MMESVAAFLRALRAAYLLLLVSGALFFLFAPHHWRSWLADRFGGNDHLYEWGIGLALLAVLLEHTRATVLQQRLAVVAQRINQLSPNLRHLEAVKILVNSLASESSATVEVALRELKRITGQDFGKDPVQWRQWVREQERPKSAPHTPE
ncbi:MAG: hypothetical protein L0Z55_01440 [Planctomycetes bacterium]|nr:hypothetical protein [Planctomycetota bacterium]